MTEARLLEASPAPSRYPHMVEIAILGSQSSAHAARSLGSSGVNFISLSTHSRMRVRNQKLQPTAAAIQPYSSTEARQHREASGQKSTSDRGEQEQDCKTPATPAPSQVRTRTQEATDVYKHLPLVKHILNPYMFATSHSQANKQGSYYHCFGARY